MREPSLRGKSARCGIFPRRLRDGQHRRSPRAGRPNARGCARNARARLPRGLLPDPRVLGRHRRARRPEASLDHVRPARDGPEDLAQARRELLGPHREREQRAQLSRVVGRRRAVLLEEPSHAARVDPFIEPPWPVHRQEAEQRVLARAEPVA